MAKTKGELPYFKFKISDWNGGDILQCSLTSQGLFVNLCALYWGKHGELYYSKMLKKFPRKQKHFDELLNEGVIKLIEDKIVISFLDEQLSERGAVSVRNANNAKEGWNGRKPDATASPSQSGRNGVAPHIEEKREEKKREEEKREEVALLEERVIVQLTAEALDLIDGVCDYFGVKKITMSIMYDTVCEYASTLLHRNELQIASIALKNYIAYKNLSQEQRHSANSWMGSMDKHFRDGQWIMMDWESKLKNLQKNGSVNGKPKASLDEIRKFSK